MNELLERHGDIVLFIALMLTLVLVIGLLVLPIVVFQVTQGCT